MLIESFVEVMNGGVIIPKWQILGSSPSPVGPNKLEVSLDTKKQLFGEGLQWNVSFNMLFSTVFDNHNLVH